MNHPTERVLIGCTVVDGTGGAPFERAAVRISVARISSAAATR